jgi:hypothetical protein
MSRNGNMPPPPRSAWVLKIINPLRISSPECFTGQRRPIASVSFVWAYFNPPPHPACHRAMGRTVYRVKAEKPNIHLFATSSDRLRFSRLILPGRYSVDRYPVAE